MGIDMEVEVLPEREAPSSLSPELVPDPARPGTWTDSEGAVDFEELFRPEALSAFGQGFIRTGAEANDWGIEPTAENAGLVITDRIPAAAALYFGLGAERAARLPGHFASSSMPINQPVQISIIKRAR